MNGMDADFLAVIGKTTKVTCRNNVTDGGGSDTTKDKFFLLSRRELFMGDEVSSVKEGEPYPYYSNYSDYTSPNTGADSNRVKYKNGSPQWQWERTPNAGAVAAFAVCAMRVFWATTATAMRTSAMGLPRLVT